MTTKIKFDDNAIAESGKRYPNLITVLIKNL